MLSKKKTYRITSDETIKRDGYTYRCLLAETPWFKEGDNLVEAAKAAFGSNLKRGGTVAIAEKVAIVTSGGLVPASSIKPGRFARFASKYVRPRGNDLSQSIPERMQFVIDRIGFPRTLLACAATAVTRPFGIRGAFFVVAGYQARDLDGMHDEYKDWLLPALRKKEAKTLVERLAVELGNPVAIVDVNYLGGHVRSRSSKALSNKHLLRALKHDPMGHNSHMPLTLIDLIDSPE